jgi:hypothetical protein
VLADRCAGFERDGEVQLRLAAMLLADSRLPISSPRALLEQLERA